MPHIIAAQYARPHLSIVPKDEIAAAVNALDARIGADIPDLEGEVTDIIGPMITVLGITTGRGAAMVNIRTELCSPIVRGKLYEAFAAVEAEARRVGPRTLAAAAAVLSLLPNA